MTEKHVVVVKLHRINAMRYQVIIGLSIVTMEDYVLDVVITREETEQDWIAFSG